QYERTKIQNRRCSRQPPELETTPKDRRKPIGSNKPDLRQSHARNRNWIKRDGDHRNHQSKTPHGVQPEKPSTATADEGARLQTTPAAT
ncbi:hypothetical protein A2U01_0059629, partial [Trifolium medium]|nr:hypothetical protein [Trifolium medium]